LAAATATRRAEENVGANGTEVDADKEKRPGTVVERPDVSSIDPVANTTGQGGGASSIDPAANTTEQDIQEQVVNLPSEPEEEGNNDGEVVFVSSTPNPNPSPTPKIENPPVKVERVPSARDSDDEREAQEAEIPPISDLAARSGWGGARKSLRSTSAPIQYRRQTD